MDRGNENNRRLLKARVLANHVRQFKAIDKGSLRASAITKNQDGDESPPSLAANL